MKFHILHATIGILLIGLIVITIHKKTFLWRQELNSNPSADVVSWKFMLPTKDIINIIAPAYYGSPKFGPIGPNGCSATQQSRWYFGTCESYVLIVYGRHDSPLPVNSILVDN